MDFGVKCKIQNYKAFRKKTEENIQDLGLSKDFLDLMPKAQSVKEKN